MPWRDDSTSSTDAAQGGYLLLVVPCDVIYIVSPLWSKNLTTLVTEWKTTLTAVPNTTWLVQQIMLVEEMIKLIKPLVEHCCCAGTSAGSLKSLWLPHCNIQVSA